MRIRWHLRQKEDYILGEEVAAVNLAIRIPNVCQRTRMGVLISQNQK